MVSESRDILSTAELCVIIVWSVPSSVCDLTRGMTVKQHWASIKSIIPQKCDCVDHPVDDQTVNVWCQVPSHYLLLDDHVMYLVR